MEAKAVEPGEIVDDYVDMVKALGFLLLSICSGIADAAPTWCLVPCRAWKGLEVGFAL